MAFLWSEPGDSAAAPLRGPAGNCEFPEAGARRDHILSGVRVVAEGSFAK
jgi:hypothetical protein